MHETYAFKYQSKRVGILEMKINKIEIDSRINIFLLRIIESRWNHPINSHRNLKRNNIEIMDKDPLKTFLNTYEYNDKSY